MRSLDGKTIFDFYINSADNSANWGMIKYLAEKTKNINSPNLMGGTYLLHYSAMMNQLVFVKWLILEKKVNIHLKDNDGNSLLHYAAISGNIEMVKFLIEEHYLDAHANNKSNQTVLSKAAESGNLALVKLLVEDYHLNPHERDNNGNTALSYAVESSQLDLIKWLIEEKKLDCKAKNDSNETLFNILARTLSRSKGENPQLLKIAQYFVEQGIDLNALTNYDRSALWTSINYGNWQVALYLFQLANEDVYKSKTAVFALHEAAKCGRVDVIEFLLNKGVDINQEDEFGGFTPLLAALNFSKYEAAKFLIAQGADLSLESSAGENALDYVSKRSNPEAKEVKRLILEKMPSSPTTITSNNLFQPPAVNQGAVETTPQDNQPTDQNNNEKKF